MSQHRSNLRPDCAHCAGLCCVALPFSASADFAIDKAAGQPCPHLQTDFRCGIHGQLRERGFAGCAAYDCFGAGQRLTQSLFAGQDWRANPQIAQRMVDLLPIMRALHELLWYLADALTFDAARPLYRDLRRARAAVAQLAGQGPDTLASVDVRGCRRDVDVLLVRASELVRTAARGRQRGVGRDLAGRDLAGAALPGAVLAGADLRECAADRRQPPGGRPASRGSAGSGPARGRPHRRRPHRLPVSHPVPARRRTRRRRDDVPACTSPPVALVLTNCPS